MVKIDIEDIINLAYNKDNDLGKTINEAVNQGLYGALHSKKSSLMHYIDAKKIDKAVKEMEKKKYDIAKIKSELTEGISCGLYFTKKGKEVFLRDRGEEKKEHGWGYKFKHPVQTVKSYFAPKPVDNIMRAAGKFYDILKMGGDFASEKFKNAVIKLNQYDFLHPIIQIAKEEKLKGINYKQTIKSINDNIKKYGKDMTAGIKEMAEEYAPAKEAAVAASVLIAASFLLLGFSANNLTGFAIAGNDIPASSTIGAGFVLLITALCLSFLKKKKTKAKQGKSRKKARNK